MGAVIAWNRQQPFAQTDYATSAVVTPYNSDLTEDGPENLVGALGLHVQARGSSSLACGAFVKPCPVVKTPQVACLDLSAPAYSQDHRYAIVDSWQGTRYLLERAPDGWVVTKKTSIHRLDPREVV